jgi:hypothetical protein
LPTATSSSTTPITIPVRKFPVNTKILEND